MFFTMEEEFIESPVDKLKKRSAHYFASSLIILFLIGRERTSSTEIQQGFALQKFWKIGQVLFVKYATMRRFWFISNVLIVVIL